MNFRELLNDDQLAAATSDAKYLRIIAGAGTGKTRALTYRIAYLLSEGGYRPEQLVGITFTNKVAKEMKDRVLSIALENNLPIDRLPLISTYHGFCVRFLRREIQNLPPFTKNFTIVDDDEQKKIRKNVASKLKLSTDSIAFKEIVSNLARVKCTGLLPQEVDAASIDSPTLKAEVFINFYEEYQNALKKINALDYDDLLIFTMVLIRKNPKIKEKYHHYYKAFLVDEYQDTNDLQYKLIKEFLAEDACLTVVGDPDQTIYTWRGANADLIRTRLKRDFPDLVTVSLLKNYRSTQTILDTANTLINQNTIDRDNKELIAASGISGEKVDVRLLPTQEFEAQYIASKIIEETKRGLASYKDIAIIYRSNYLSRAIETALSQKGIPYRIYGGHRFYDRAVIKTALAYLRILVNPQDDSSFERLIQSPRRGLGDQALGKVKTFAEENELSLLETSLGHLETIGLGGKAKSSLLSLKSAMEQVIDELQDENTNIEDIDGIINDYFHNTGFLNYVDELDKKTKEKEGKNADLEIDNVKELINNIKMYFNNPPQEDEENEEEDNSIPSLLGRFLSTIALQTSQDDMVESEAVSLMTVHVSKGLEFPEVFVTGLVNGIFPTSHALYDNVQDDALEEERRMLYVAFTRAKKRLHVTYFRGYNYILREYNEPSIFLNDAGLSPFISEAPQRQPITPALKTYNDARSIKEKLNNLPQHDDLNSLYARAGEKSSQRKSSVYSGLQNSSTVKNVYEVGGKVISTSYGVGTVLEINGDKITAHFANKEFGPKEVKFVNTGVAFKPYKE